MDGKTNTTHMRKLATPQHSSQSPRSDFRQISYEQQARSGLTPGGIQRGAQGGELSEVRKTAKLEEDLLQIIACPLMEDVPLYQRFRVRTDMFRSPKPVPDIWPPSHFRVGTDVALHARLSPCREGLPLRLQSPG